MKLGNEEQKSQELLGSQTQNAPYNADISRIRNLANRTPKRGPTLDDKKLMVMDRKRWQG
jgi:hypothetical protein